jgi:hypothetical protein
MWLRQWDPAFTAWRAWLPTGKRNHATNEQFELKHIITYWLMVLKMRGQGFCGRDTTKDVSPLQVEWKVGVRRMGHELGVNFKRVEAGEDQTSEREH